MKRIEERYNCLGYFGFGNGIGMHEGAGMYCNGCPMAQACWEVHKDRVRKFVPAVAEHIDDLGKQENGQQKIAEFVKEHKTEPYTALMAGNMEDAMYVLTSGKPKDRGKMTIPYPFDKDGEKKYEWHSDSPNCGDPNCICDECHLPITENQGPAVRIWDDPESENCKEMRFHTECWPLAQANMTSENKGGAS
jgi:hypothetical protein